MHQLQSFGEPTSMGIGEDLSWKEFFRDPASPTPNVTKQSMPMHGHHDNPQSQLIRCGSAVERCSETQSSKDAFSLSLIWACKNKDLSRGTRIHNELQKRGLVEKNYSDALITMYAKCGDLKKAQALLDMHNSTSVITWTALIASYARRGQGQNALDCFEQMQLEGISPNAVTYKCILKACALTRAIEKGKQIHDEILRQGFLEHNIVLGGALVDMYAKCGALSQAQSVVEKLPSRDVVSWSSLIGGYAQKGQGRQALECFQQMQGEGVSPNAVTYVCILKACAVIGDLDKGKQIHDEISRQGLLEHNVVLGGALVDMYVKCGALPQAQRVLQKLPSRDVISWSALITGYAQKGQGKQALECLEKMLCEGICPDAATYVCILKACAVMGDIDKGKQIHDEILRQGLLEHSIVLGNALVDMYAKFGDLTQAQTVLEILPSRNMVTWSTLIVGYAQKGRGQEALECFDKMEREGIAPDAVTYVCVLKACAVIEAIDKGKQIHDKILRQGLLEHSIVLGGALVDMYAKCGALCEAQNVLDKLPSRDVVSWNALIAGYAQKGQGQHAVECFEQMQRDGISPNAVTYLCIVKACAVIGAFDKGKEIHNEISRQGLLEYDLVLGNALVDMYAKCGALPQAQSVLEKLSSRNVVSWNALVTGYAQEGQGEQALKCFEQMQHEGILPDKVTFLCLLNLCSHLGMVEKGQEFFDHMATYGLNPDIEAFTCMVDLLGRAGHLIRAVEVIQQMPFPANASIWLCLMGACRKWVDVNVGIWAFEQAVKLDKCGGAAYALMVSIYAAAGMPEKANDVEAMRIQNKAWKQPTVAASSFLHP